MATLTRLFAASLVALLIASCGGGGDDGVNVPAASREIVVFAWNDLGMHCLNPTYDTAVILPPYNTVWAQVVRRGTPPEIITAGVTVEYRMVNNSTSQKFGTNPIVSDFRKFWANVQALFGTKLVLDTGLNLVDPAVHNNLSGTMLAKGDHFEVDGVPVTPVDDDLVWNPYQILEVTVKDGSGTVVAQTRATVPTSDEIHCDRCHGADPFTDILARHDTEEGTNLLGQQPVLCASCHGSPILGAPLQGGIPYLSEAIHSFHARNASPTCCDCHPGPQTQCNRSLRHNAADGGCTNTSCHGSLANVGGSIAAGRLPWVGEPKCATCHGGTTIPAVDTGSALYRNAMGHGGMACPACHGSPHAMQYQGKAITIGSCAVCHGRSRGDGAGEFGEEHGGTRGRSTACHTCHTVVPATPTRWPHAYKWRDRGGLQTQG